jgi:hypothetical protein
LDDKYRLNVTWTLNGALNPPEKITLQYFRRSQPIATDIVTLGKGVTKYLFTPSKLEEGKDYQLKIIEAKNEKDPKEPSQFIPLVSGTFAVYSPGALIADVQMPPASHASSHEMSWVCVVALLAVYLLY